MDTSWLNILGHDLIVLVLLGLISEVWSYRGELERFEERWVRFVARQRQRQRREAQAGLPGLGRQPGCRACQVNGVVREERVSPPPWLVSRRGRRRQVQARWQYCPVRSCAYYGWPGLGNLRSNGHPNGSRWRQWQGQACGGYFMETRGTPLYRRTVAVEGVGQVLRTLAEGVSLPGTVRLCGVEVETVAVWLELGAVHFAELAEYLSRDLAVNQVQLDDLYVWLRAAQSKPKG